MLANDIEVEVARQGLTVDGVTYPAGTYIVKMDQAKAGLANTMLWDGEDISEQVSTMYDISAWSLPELWGFEAIATHSEIKAVSSKVNKINEQGNLVGKGPYLIPNSSVKSVELVNKLLQNGITVKRDTNGNFYVEAQKGNLLRDLVRDSGLTVSTATVPSSTKVVQNMRVAILKDVGIGKQQSHAGTKLALERLGFDVTELHPRTVATNGLTGYDVFIYSGTNNLISYANNEANKEFWLENQAQQAAFFQHVQQFVDNGGKYIAVGGLASIASRTMGITDVTVHSGSANSNGIVKVDYLPSSLTAGYSLDDIGFVYRPTWYSNTGGKTVVAKYAETQDFFVAGHWRNRSAAQGQPVIVKHNDKDVTLIGLEAGFRDHTDYLFRLLSNAIFD